MKGREAFDKSRRVKQSKHSDKNSKDRDNTSQVNKVNFTGLLLS